MTELSPQVQSVLDAFMNGYVADWDYGMAFGADRKGLAAALRAAARRTEADSIWVGHPEHTGVRWAADHLLAIAAELEGHHD